MRPNDELLQKISQVRKRWKAFLWVRGLAWALGVLAASLAVAVALADSPSVPYAALTALRLLLVGAVAFTVWRALVVPLRRTPTDVQLARFVEEKNPGLEERVVSAVEAIQKPKTEQSVFHYLLVKDALERTRNVRFGDQINKRKFNAFATMSGAFGAALLVGLYVASLFFPHGVPNLLALRPPDREAPKVTVTPGDVTVPKGEDVVIQAVFTGIDAERAEIRLRYDNSPEWETSLMDVVPENLPTYRHVIFNIQGTVRYYVDARGIRSDEFTIRVADLPRVEKLTYTYNYPAYSGMAPKTEEDALDMVAVKGTVVDVVVTGSQPLSRGQIVFADGKTIPLTPSGDKQVAAKVTVDRNTTFRIKLWNTNGGDYLGQEEYAMEALDDQKPIIEFTKPGRDYPATNLEEVFTELRAEDDFGVNALDLYYSVNGGEEKKVELFRNRSQESPKEQSASHTFFLEEFGLKPGDFVMYYGRATDSRNPANTAQTDVYFIEVRPFSRDFYQGQEAGQRGGQRGGGGGGQNDSAAALARRQKDIIAGTTNLMRDKDKYQPKEYTDKLHALAEAQAKLKESAETVVGRMVRRELADETPEIKQLTENLKLAIEQMDPAVEHLNKEAPQTALPYEQKALNHLMIVQSLFTQVQVQRGARGGGGGGGGQQAAQDLADLFELELDQSKNQYETIQRGELSQEAQQQVEETLDKIRDIIQRQQKQMERRAQPGAGGGASDQMTTQELQREVERLQRQLETLSRQNNDPQLQQAARDLQQAARNLQQQSQGTAQQQQQAAQAAQQALERAQRRLQQQQGGGAGGGGGSQQERLAQAQQQAGRILEQQRQIASQTEQLNAAQKNAAGNAAQQTQLGQQAKELAGQQDNVSDELAALEQQLQSAANAGRENREAADRARAAVSSMRSNQLEARSADAAAALENRNLNRAIQRQGEIQKMLSQLEQQIGQASSAAAGNNRQAQLENALNRTGEITNRIQSMQRRLGQQQGQQPGQQQGQQQNNPQGQQNTGQQNRGQGQQANQSGPNGGGQRDQQGQPGGVRNGGQFGPTVGPNGREQAVDNASRPGGYVDPRQLGSELRERLGELRDLRGILSGDRDAVAQIDRVINRLEGFRSRGFTGDPEELSRIAQEIIDPLRALELELSRELQVLIGQENIRSVQEDELPSEARKYIEEYFKRIGSQK